MARIDGKRNAAALVCLLMIWGTLFPLSPAAAAGDAGSPDSSTPGPAVTDVVAVSDGIQITWETQEDATKYALYRRVDEESWVKYTVVSGSSYTDRHVVFGTKYAYATRSLNADGSYMGAMGRDKCLFYGAEPNLDSITSVSGGLRVTWDGSDDAAGYVIYRRAAAGSWIRYAAVSGTSYTDRNILPGIEYTYTVRALDQNGKYFGLYDTQGISYAYYAPPELLSAFNESEGIAVSWRESPGAAGYAVYRKTEDGSWGVYALTERTSFTDRDTAEGLRYDYTVQALDDEKTALGGFDPSGLSVTRFSDPEATVAEKLYARRNMEGYREGSPWGRDVLHRNTLPRNGCAAGCVCGSGDYAFVMDMQEYAADADLTVRRREARYDALPEIHVGDALLLESGARSAMVIDVAEDGHTVVVCEGNYDGSVHWGRVIDLSDPDSALICVETFY